MAVCSTAHAQTIDQFDVRREGNNAVLQLRFGTEVQLQRSVSTRSGDLTLIFYSLVSTTNAELRSTQSLRLGARQGLPEMALFDEIERGERQRKIVLRTSDAARINVRAGAGNRSIEVVVVGGGAAVTAAQAAPVRRAPSPAVAPETAPVQATPATLPEADRRFVIVLLSSSDPNVQLPAMIPRGLQSYDVFTAERIVNGSRKYEIHLGHFATRTQAEAVMKQLGAFPLATIVAAAPAPATLAAAPAPAPVPAPVPTPAPAPVPAPVPTPVPIPTPEPVPAPATAPAVPSPPAGTAVAPVAPVMPPVAVSPADVPVLKPEEVEARAEALMSQARSAIGEGNHAAAIDPLNALLNLPPNRQTRPAQELIGQARARSGDVARARIEYETFLQLYPQGSDSDRVRRELAALPAPAPAAVAERPRPPVETTVTGSASMTYFGGNGQVRSQEFKDSPVAGLPQVAGDPLFTDDKASQLLNDVDLTWRRRDADTDMRFVLRDSYTTDLERSEKSKNRLSSLYFDYKSLAGGYGARLGRQSPTGGGVMGRYDGASGYYLVKPKIKLGAVAGVPSDKYFDSKRRFYGASVDVDGLVPNTGAALYGIEQTIDGYKDRQAVGLELRYFRGGASVFSQFDYDTMFQKLNIATVQGTLILEDATVFNVLYDKRALTMLALGNALTFEDPANPGVLYTKIADKIATTTLEALREQIKQTTPYITQAQLGITKPLDKTWQVGASMQLTNTGAIPPVPGVVGFESGRPATGNIYTISGQLIGLNLYSSRDTHVFSTSAIASAAVDGLLVSYNLSSVLAESWQLEPSLQYYRDRTPQGATSQRWTPGFRVTYRGFQRWAIESSITYEIGKASRVTPDPNDPTLNVTTKESSNRVNYSLGVRYEF
jgi:hypothetical protein